MRRVDDGNRRQDTRKSTRISEQRLVLQKRPEDAMLDAVIIDKLQHDVSPDSILTTGEWSLYLGMSLNQYRHI